MQVSKVNVLELNDESLESFGKTRPPVEVVCCHVER
jgi:hypothetical protein